jgi:phosphopantothenate synthetase
MSRTRDENNPLTEEAEPVAALTATPAATVVINTEKVAVATDNVPEGATETNADVTVNLYDAAGNITGSVTKEETDKMAAEVTKIVDEEGKTLANLK